MPLIILAVVFVGLGVGTWWSRRRTRRRLLRGSAADATSQAPGMDPRTASNITRSVIDAQNGQGYL